MKEYPYTKYEMEQIISEYMEIEGIEIIAEEEMTDLFGATFFDEHVYWYPRHMYGDHVYTYLTDYDQYLLDNGYDPILGDYVDELTRQDTEPWIEMFESLQILEDISDTD